MLGMLWQQASASRKRSRGDGWFRARARPQRRDAFNYSTDVAIDFAVASHEDDHTW